MQVIYKIIENVAKSKAGVFITGESGTGKELCAAAIHQASPRHNGPFITVNCAAIPKDLFESEIFGHVKEAFSGATSDRQGAAELADGGTLFLDEIGEMDLNLQAKLLRLIQTETFQRVGGSQAQKVDVRYVCATNRDPIVEVAAGRFREDLYYRLNVVPIELPPLRERDDDILQIAKMLLNKFNQELNKSFSSFSTEVEDRFLAYDWPGNVGELQNVIENAVIMNDGDILTETMLPDTFFKSSALYRLREDSNNQILAAVDISPSLTQPLATGSNTESIKPLWLTEKLVIEDAIKLCHGNITEAATKLKVSPSTLYRKIKNWDQQTGK
jgi:two-component system repressor protein LuxO